MTDFADCIHFSFFVIFTDFVRLIKIDEIRQSIFLLFCGMLAYLLCLEKFFNENLKNFEVFFCHLITKKTSKYNNVEKEYFEETKKIFVPVGIDSFQV
jgi:hypothetical protein